MTTKHTPGPWETQGATTVVSRGHFVPGQSWLTPVAQVCCNHAAGEAANARLIAAAPELLEALREMLAVSLPTGDGTRTDLAIEQAEAAIAKAIGN